MSVRRGTAAATESSAGTSAGGHGRTASPTLWRQLLALSALAGLQTAVPVARASPAPVVPAAEEACESNASEAAASPAASALTPFPPVPGGAVDASYVPGEFAELLTWLPCTVAADGKGGTFDVKFANGQTFQGAPAISLRKPGREWNWRPGATRFTAGDSCEIMKWEKCRVQAKGARPDTYDLHVPGAAGPRQRRLGVPAASLRKHRGRYYLRTADPRFPSRVPGTTCGGVCAGVEPCTKIFAGCAARKRQAAAENCGGRACDLVLMGDSIIERLAGRMCYSGNAWSFNASMRVFDEKIRSRHTNSMILGGTCDETSQTLYMLEQVLPVLLGPKVVLLLVGTNNIPKAGSRSAIDGVKAVVQRLRRAYPRTHVLVHALLPRSDDGGRSRFQDHIDEANAGLAAYAGAARSNTGAPISFVDCSGPMKQDLDASFDDRLHPSPEGYRRLLSCLQPILDTAVLGSARS